MTIFQINQLDEYRDANVEVVFKIIDAAKKDHALSPLNKKKFSLRAYERRLNVAFPKMDNKTALQTAVRTTRIKAGLSKGNSSTISGDDLTRIAMFFLVNLSGYDWSNIIEYLKSADDRYKVLLTLSKGDNTGAGIDIVQVLNQRVGDLRIPGQELHDSIRGIADIMEAQSKDLRMKNSEIDHLKRDSAAMREKVAAVSKGFEVVLEAFEKASPEEQAVIQKEINRLSFLLKSLQSFY